MVTGSGGTKVFLLEGWGEGLGAKLSFWSAAVCDSVPSPWAAGGQIESVAVLSWFALCSIRPSKPSGSAPPRSSGWWGGAVTVVTGCSRREVKFTNTCGESLLVLFASTDRKRSPLHKFTLDSPTSLRCPPFHDFCRYHLAPTGATYYQRCGEGRRHHHPVTGRGEYSL